MGTPERKARERKAREDHILNVAEKVFFNKGFDASTIDDIVHEAELSKGALYHYFKNKNELCIGIVSRGLSILVEYMQNARNRSKGMALDQLKNIALSYLKFQQDHPKYYCALQNYRHHRGGCGRESKFLGQALSGNQRIREIFAEIIKLGMNDRSIRGDIDPQQTAAALWGEMNALLPGFDLNSNPVEAYEQAVDIIIAGLAGK